MSTVSSTPTLASWDPKELFELVNPDKLSITCVGYAQSCRRRCMNTIAHRNVQAAKALMSQIARPAASNDELKGMLFDLAGYTLCRGYHQDQARTVSDRWFGMVQRQLGDEDDRGSDTSEDDGDDSDSDSDSSTGSGSTTDSDSDEDDDDSNRTNTFDNNGGELRRRFEELETLQREFGELLQRQRQNLQNRASSPSTTTQTQQAQASSKSSRDAAGSSTTYQHQKSPEALRSAEQKRQEEAHQTAEHNRAVAREQLRSERTEQIERDEALRQAQRERPEQEATAQAELLLQQQRAEQARLERAAKAEAERLLKAQKAEKARLELERRAKEQEQARSLSWESAWDRYEAAWSELICSNGETDISTSAIWPTKSGLLHSCCEEDVKAFFCCRPESMNRRMVRRQALRWHPDRAARLFATVVDQQMVGEILKNVTMISQVVNGIMGATVL